MEVKNVLAKSKIIVDQVQASERNLIVGAVSINIQLNYYYHVL